MEYLDESKIEALRNILREDTNKPNRNTNLVCKWLSQEIANWI
jgi:hypothetical protein